ncbi:MAG: trypsin-like serine protease, partial [Dietzia sp.]|nr:trypsin-like serine protease [Dietzia sp.]
MRFTRAAVAFAAALGLSVGAAAPAAAITNGTPDGDAHPYVGIMIAYQDEVPRWRCSGTLVSPTVFLTAGHCTFEADRVRIWFDENARTEGSGYPFATGRGLPGTPYDHPDYDDNAFYLNDLGVVVLDEPVAMEQYGAVAPLGYFDPLFVRRGQSKQEFTAV